MDILQHTQHTHAQLTVAAVKVVLARDAPIRHCAPNNQPVNQKTYFCEDRSSGSRDMLVNRQSDRHTHRQTDRQTDKLIAILRSPIGAE